MQVDLFQDHVCFGLINLEVEYTRCNKFPDVKLANQVVYDFLAIKFYLFPFQQFRGGQKMLEIRFCFWRRCMGQVNLLMGTALVTSETNPHF